MKKVVLALAVIATVVCFSSCTKKCNCKTSTEGFTPTTQEVTIKNGKCSDMNTSSTTMGITTKTECEQI